MLSYLVLVIMADGLQDSVCIPSIKTPSRRSVR